MRIQPPELYLKLAGSTFDSTPNMYTSMNKLTDNQKNESDSQIKTKPMPASVFK